MRIIGGSLLTGLGLLAEVINEWLRHAFFALYYIAKGIMLEGAGSFPGVRGYEAPESVHLFAGTQILIWAAIVAGIVLLVQGIRMRESDR